MGVFGGSAPVVVVSPHLDDGVFSCGQLLADHPGSVVVTLFAGRPPAGAGLTEWDAAAGFRAGEDVIAARRREDCAALRLLGARPVWLDFRDSQYGDTPGVGALAGALDAALDATGLPAVFVPLGLFHSDHRLAHEAALGLVRRRPGRDWYAYADALYRHIPGLVDDRLRALAAAGFAVAPIETTPTPAGEVKRRAVAAYRSQLRALATPGRPGHADAFAPERYWRLAAPGEAPRGR
jgi:LmbE family N-acetylglucosaminyl deacetylase